jgi:DNA polymerase III delta subunit
MKYSEALKVLNHKREKVFALVGPETFLKEFFTKTAKEVFPDYEYMEYSPETQQGALDIIGGENLFSSSLVVLRNFDKMALAKFESGVKKFDGCIIFLIQEKADLKTRAMTSILSHATIVDILHG